MGDCGAVSYILGSSALKIKSTNGLEENRRNGDVFWNACTDVKQATNAAVERRIVACCSLTDVVGGTVTLLMFVYESF